MLHSPAALRNQGPIAAQLEAYLKPIPAGGHILEVASGGGTHVAFLAPQYPQLQWHPTEADVTLVRRMESLLASMRLPNVQPPRELDIATPVHMLYPDTRFEAVLNVNMAHISPWASTLGLMDNAAQLLVPRGYLFMYGPFAANGRNTPESNRQFDATLRGQDPDWGIRDVADVIEAAARVGLGLTATHDMPANNKLQVFQKM